MSAERLNVRELLELERQIYQESIDRVQQQQQKLRSGDLEDFIRRCKPFEADREQALAAARAQLQFSRQDARSLLAFDLQQAEDVFQADKQQLKRQLLDTTRRRRLKLEKRLKALNKKAAAAKNREKKARNVGHLTGERLDPDLLEKQLRRVQRRTMKAFNFRHLSHGVLPTPQRIVSDVMQECANLQHNREREEAARMASEEGAPSKLQVEVKDGRKLVITETNEEFTVGDGVVLLSKLTEEEFHGFVAAISTEEVQLVLVCGSRARVTLNRLRSGQCSLRHQDEKPLAMEPLEYTHGNFRTALTAGPTLESLVRDPPDLRRRAAALNRRKRKTTVDIRRGF